MLTLILLIGGWFSEAQPPETVINKPVNLGENLEYKVSFGWFTVGRASWTTDSKRHTYGGEECYKVQINGRSSGFLGVFAKVDDEWGEYLRVDDFMPMMTYRDIEEGKYLLEEKIYFDYTTRKIRLEKVRKGERKPTTYSDMDVDRMGMLGGVMQMRSLDFSKYKPGDEVKIDAIFEEDRYEMVVKYVGIVELKSKVGRLQAYKVIPVMPENKLFPGENPITAWFSADKNRLPLRVDAKMSFGTVYVELVNYENVKFGPDYDY